jgi:hypothetical protein
MLEQVSEHRSIYCGGVHRLHDGAPLGHACRVLDPDFLRAELDEEYASAAELLEIMPIVLHRGLSQSVSDD